MNADAPDCDPAGPDDSGADDKALDVLLRRAAWPEPSAASTARLRARWEALRRRRPARRLILWATAGGAAAAAAAVVLAVAGRWHRPPAPMPPGPGPVVLDRPGPAAPRAAVVPVWRPPTLLEAAVARRAMAGPPAARPRPPARPG